MNQIQIGRFIASERKRLGFTQKQLAEKLNISDKTISKWECGNGFPDVSLLIPLCSELEITVNELLSGERVSEEDYQKKAEENMMMIIKEKEENKKRYVLTIICGIISVVSYLTILLVVCFYTNEISTPVKLLLISVACAILAVGIFISVNGDRTIGYFKCKHCGEHFVPSRFDHNISAHIVTTRHLKCPHCHKKSWCKKVMSKEG